MIKEKIIRKYIKAGEHVFISLTPTIGEALSAEGVIKRLDSNGWFQLEFMELLDEMIVEIETSMDPNRKLIMLAGGQNM